MKEPSILVTGGAGFIGANFVLDWLRTESGSIVNVDKLTYAGNPESLASVASNASHRLVQADICDQEKMASLLAEYTPVAVVHFAAESHVDRSIHGPAAFIETNVVGTFRLLEAVRAYWNTLEDDAKQAFRFLHVSTDEVYGSLSETDPPFTETTTYEPNSPYSASKAGSDHLVRAYHHTYGLPTLTTNCSNNYGPYQHSQKSSSRLVISIRRRRPPDPGVRGWLEHPRLALRRAITSGRWIRRVLTPCGVAVGETYNVGGW